MKVKCWYCCSYCRYHYSCFCHICIYFFSLSLSVYLRLSGIHTVYWSTRMNMQLIDYNLFDPSVINWNSRIFWVTYWTVHSVNFHLLRFSTHFIRQMYFWQWKAIKYSCIYVSCFWLCSYCIRPEQALRLQNDNITTSKFSIVLWIHRTL